MPRSKRDPHAQLVGEPLEALRRDVEDVVVVGAGGLHVPYIHFVQRHSRARKVALMDADDQGDRQVLASPAQHDAQHGHDHRSVQPAPQRDAAEQTDDPPASGRTAPGHARDAQQRDRVRPHGVGRDRPHGRREAQDGHRHGSTPLRELRPQREEHEMQRQGGRLVAAVNPPGNDASSRRPGRACGRSSTPAGAMAITPGKREITSPSSVSMIQIPASGSSTSPGIGIRRRAIGDAGVHQVPGRVVRGVVVPATAGFEARGDGEERERDQEQRQRRPPPTASPTRGRLRGLGGGSQHGHILVHRVRLRP